MLVNKIYLCDDKMTALCNTQDGHFDVTIDDLSSSRVALVEAMTHYSNGEYDRYGNAMAMFEKLTGDYRKLMMRAQIPPQPGTAENTGGSGVTVFPEQARALLGRPHPGTRVLERRMRRKGRWRGREYIPCPGDIIFLAPGRDGRVGHCGVVERVDGGTVTSIDGNTVDPDGHFPPEEGGAVARRIRRRDDPVIVGYGAAGI